MLKAAVLSREATEEALAKARELEEKDRKERKKDKKKQRKVPMRDSRSSARCRNLWQSCE